MPRTVNNLFTTHGKDVLSSGAERVKQRLSTSFSLHECYEKILLCGESNPTNSTGRAVKQAVINPRVKQQE